MELTPDNVQVGVGWLGFGSLGVWGWVIVGLSLARGGNWIARILG